MRPGDLIAERFALEREVGAGAMGVVFRARDALTGEAVALKALAVQGPAFAERFVREARVLAGLRHPAIVRYVAHGTTAEGEHYLVMEWLDGEDLEARLARGPLGPTEAVALVRRVADALALAHGLGVVHRDIKPSNVFLPGGDTGRARLLDFGIARLGPGTHARTRTGIILGTPGYMAPEQIRSDRDLDGRADVFALGCVLFECLTGQAAFVGDSVMALLARILLEDATRASALVPELPAALDELLASMMAREPSSRPADGAALVAALDALPALAPDPAASARPSRESLTGGEKRLACVVLAGTDDFDVSGTAATHVAHSPEEKRALDQALAPAVRAYGGRLERLGEGSLVVTLGSARGAASDQAARAARCALAVRAIMPQVPMALAMGWVEADGVVGPVLERAARMLRAVAEADRDGVRTARPVRIDEVTAGLLDAGFELEGRPGARELLGAREETEALRSFLGRPSPCVGRERELALLRGAWEACVDEPSARAVLVIAPAGTGKSRLRYEFLRALREDHGAPLRVLIARGDPTRAGSPFGMIAPLVRGEAGILEGDALPVRQRKLHARLALRLAGRELARVADFLGELVGAPFADEGRTELRAARQDPRLLGDQMQRAWEDWLAVECAAQPVLVVLEDLQWGDLPSVKFIDGALRNLADRPLLVLAIARPEVHDLFPRLWAGRALEELRLGGLARRAAERLVRHALGDAVDPATVARLVEHAGGNAYYLEELIRSGATDRRDTLPETVLVMVQERLAAVAPEARRVLRAASVFGQSFWPGGVRALLGPATSEGALAECLDELIERELVARRGEGKFPGEVEHFFRHPLVREAAYATLTGADRVLGHRLAGAWLEGAGEGDATALAEHYERGDVMAPAAAWYRRAAELARDGDDMGAVLARTERAVACGAAGEALGAVRLLQAEACRWRGDNAAAQAHGEAALELLPRASGPWFQALAELAVAAGKRTDRARLLAVAELLRATEPAAEGVAARVETLASTLVYLLQAGETAAAEALTAALERDAGAAIERGPRIAGVVHRVRAAWAVRAGDAGAYLLEQEAAAASFSRAGDLRNACVQRVHVAHARMELGAWVEAEAALREVGAVAARMQLQRTATVAEHNLGFVLAHLGRYDEALALEARALAQFQATGSRRMEGATQAYLATIRLAAGDPERALEDALAAVETLTVAPPARAYALATLARVWAALGQAEAALQAAEEGVRVLAEVGAIEEGESAVRLAYVEALEGMGRHDAALEALREALARVQARAARIGDEGFRASFLTAVPDNARTLALARARLRDA